MGAEGLETGRQNAGKTGVSEISGPTSGPISSKVNSVALLWKDTYDFLQASWRALKVIETTSDDLNEAREAELAREAVDRILAALEKGSR